MYSLLCISVISASLNSILLKKIKLTKKTDVFKFNLLGVIIWCCIYLIMNKCSMHINYETLFWGITYGLTQSFFVLFKSLAMNTGSVSVTTLIGNSSLLISIFVSLILWNEAMSCIDFIGLGIFLTAIFMCTYKKTNSVYTAAWKYYTLFFFICASLVGIVFKAFGKLSNLDYCDDMMFIAAVTMLVCYSVACLASGSFNSAFSEKKHRTDFFIYAVVCGVLSCLYNRLNIHLAGCMDAIIFFPAFNGGVVLLSASLSILFCGEHLSKTQKTGILLGVSAICLIGIL